MALQTADFPFAPSAQVVANAFVEQYYHILHHSPELVYRFYQESSVLSRQEKNGKMTSVTTMQGINEKILALDYKNYKAEIKTADAQESYKDGVIVLVTGCLTGKDNLKKKFAQSFFLAPQAKGYFVLNDVFRYVDENESLKANATTIEKVDDSGAVAHMAADTDVSTSHEDNDVQGQKSFQTFEKDKQVDNAEQEVPAIPQPSENQILASQQSAEEDGVKNSYASIVKKAKGSPGPTKVYVPANTIRSASTNTQKKSSVAVAPASASAVEPSVQISSKAPEDINTDEEVEGHSVYVRNLPMNMMVAQLEEELRRFGPIKQGGVQVRSNRTQGTCYGFVEFLSASSVEGAIQASPITIGGRQAFVEMKTTNNRVDGGRGRFPAGRGGFRSDSFRGRGGYGGGRGFGRGEYSSSRGRGSSGRGGEGYYRGRGRSSRQGRVNQNNDAT